MKRLSAFATALFLVVLLSASAWAYPLPAYSIKNGNTVVGDFVLSGLSESEIDFWNEYWSGGRGHVFLIEDSNVISYVFAISPLDSPIYFAWSSTSNSVVAVAGTSPFNYISFTYNSSEASYYSNGLGWVGSSAMLPISCVVGHSFDETISLPDLGVDYVAKYQGELIFSTDSDSPENPDDDHDDGILGFLKAFWDKLKTFFLSIFVPPAGYFTDWFNEIRSAFDAKFGGIGSLWDSLTSSFSSLQTSTADMTGLYLTFPNGHWFSGYRGITVNLIAATLPYLGTVKGWANAILIVFTLMVVYRNNTAMLGK